MYNFTKGLKPNEGNKNEQQWVKITSKVLNFNGEYDLHMIIIIQDSIDHNEGW